MTNQQAALLEPGQVVVKRSEPSWRAEVVEYIPEDLMLTPAVPGHWPGMIRIKLLYELDCDCGCRQDGAWYIDPKSVERES